MPIKYTQELKQRAVEFVPHAQADPDTSYATVAQIAGELGLSEETLRVWVPNHRKFRGRHPCGVSGPRRGKPQVARGSQTLE